MQNPNRSAIHSQQNCYSKFLQYVCYDENSIEGSDLIGMKYIVDLLDAICAVVFSSDPHFDDGHVDLHFGEDSESQQSQKFEVGRHLRGIGLNI